MNQKDPLLAKLEQRAQSVMTLLIMVTAVLLIQLWLLSIALEEFMASESRLAIPTFAASCACLIVNLFLLKYLNDVDGNGK
jgi:di/tricarboxylate transporter